MRMTLKFLAWGNYVGSDEREQVRRNMGSDDVMDLALITLNFQCNIQAIGHGSETQVYRSGFFKSRTFK